jgi:hypothetical protein
MGGTGTPVDARDTRCYSPLMAADLPRLTMLKRLLHKLREFLNKRTDVHYTSVPVWKPWRDF